MAISVKYEQSGDRDLRMLLTGRLDNETTSTLWPEVIAKCQSINPEHLRIEASAVSYCDSAGISLLLKLRDIQQSRNNSFTIEGLKPEFNQLLTLFDPGKIETEIPKGSFIVNGIEDVGKSIVQVFKDLAEEVSFIGELTVKMTSMLLHPLQLRWQDAMLIAEKTGANAVGIVSLMGFLIGLILAFQSAVPMKMFGADIFVADLVSISMFRELGPLITAIIVASRTGSSFAAEIGTMTVNEEVDALVTMGLDPVKFLVIPRVLSTIFVMPLLTMFNNIIGLIGAAIVMLSFGFSSVTYMQRIQLAVSATDVIGGLIKTLVFGALIGSIGCLRGLQTRRDASGVGDAATRAVVTSIVAIVVSDGVFAVIYYYLKV